MLQRRKTDVDLHCRDRQHLGELLFAALLGGALGAVSPTLRDKLYTWFPSLFPHSNGTGSGVPPSKGTQIPPKGGTGSTPSGGGVGTTFPPPLPGFPPKGAPIPPGSSITGGGTLSLPPQTVGTTYPSGGGPHGSGLHDPNTPNPTLPRVGHPSATCPESGCSPYISIAGCAGSISLTGSKNLKQTLFQQIEVTVACGCDCILYYWGSASYSLWDFSQSDWNDALNSGAIAEYYWNAGSATLLFPASNTWPNNWLLVSATSGEILAYERVDYLTECYNVTLPSFTCCNGNIYIETLGSTVLVEQDHVEYLDGQPSIPDLLQLATLNWLPWNGDPALLVTNPVRIKIDFWYPSKLWTKFYLLGGLNCMANSILKSLPCSFYNATEVLSPLGIVCVKLTLPWTAGLSPSDRVFIEDDLGHAVLQDPNLPPWEDNLDGTISVFIEKKYFVDKYRLSWQCASLCAIDKASVAFVNAPPSADPCRVATIYDLCSPLMLKIGPVPFSQDRLPGSVEVRNSCPITIFFYRHSDVVLPFGVGDLKPQLISAMAADDLMLDLAPGTHNISLPGMVYQHAIVDSAGHLLSLDSNVAKNCPYNQQSYITCCGGQFWTYDGEIPYNKIYWKTRPDFNFDQGVWTPWDGQNVGELINRVLWYHHPSGQDYYFDSGCCRQPDASGLEVACDTFSHSTVSIGGYDYVRMVFPADIGPYSTLPLIHIILQSGYRVNPWGNQPVVGNYLSNSEIVIHFSPLVFANLRYVIFSCKRICIK